MKVVYILLSLIVVTILLCLIPMFGSQEGYSNVGYVSNPNPSHKDYIEIGKKKYNPLADPTDVLGPGLFGATMSNQDRIGWNQQVQSATDTITLKQTGTNRMTFMDPTHVNAKVAVPPQNEIVEKIRKCESRKTRDACDILDDPEYKECGVCIVDGTGILENTSGGHIGGLFMTEKDRQRAEQFNGKDGKRYVAQYQQPSQGKCLPNNFFINKADCIRAANIQNCKEIGDSGRGLLAGRTVENKTATQAECAQCGDNKNAFVYQPKADTISSIRLRAIAPIGTGLTRVRVFRKGGELLGEASQTGGKESVINLSDAVKENEELDLIVIQEFPYRSTTGGQKEVFYMDKGATKISNTIVEARRTQGLEPYAEGYATNAEAVAACARIGCELATLAQLRDANGKGLQTCNFGWLKDQASPYKSAKASIAKSSSSTCEATEGITANENAFSAGAWCFGVKPNSGRYQYTESNNTLYDTVIAPFFTSFGPDSVPSQGNRPTRNSQHAVVDRDYVAPNYRAVILQWEATDADDNVMNMVRFPIRPTITQIDNYNVNAETASEQSVLRQYGTFGLSRIVLQPRPNNASLVNNDAAWFWSMSNVSQSVKITARVPGLLKLPFYSEEQQKCAGKPIVTKQETLDTLRISACDTNPSNQSPGTYTVDCLKELFENAGGDLYEGRLSPLHTTRSDANIGALLKSTDGSNRHKESILSFLREKYLIATTGRNSAGALAGGTNPADQKVAINNAALDLFGFEIVSPCEDIVVNQQGIVLVSTKKGPFNEDCLDLLYRNAGYETDRVQERLKNNRKVLKPTYQTIDAKFSGLMSKDLASTEDKKKFPMRTCSDKGLINPKHADNEIRKNAIAAANEAGNTIDDIQAFYNTIYMNANKSYQGVRPEDAYAQKEYIEQCYGIKTMDESAPENMSCGVTARYIRILRSVLSEGEKPISLSQVVVLNPAGINIAKGKRVSFRSIKQGAAAFRIVDGSNVDTVRTDLRNMYVDGGSEKETTASLYGQFVQIDLGKPEEVRTVRVVHGGTEQNLDSTMGLIVQLLDNNGKVVTQKVLDRQTINESMIGILTFRKDDVIDEVPANSVAIGLQADLFNMQFIRNALGKLDFNIGTIVFDKQTADTNGFMILNQNGEYLGCSRTGNVAQWVPARDRGNFYIEFFIVPAINGAMGAVSIELARTPGRYLVKDYTGASFGSFMNVTEASSNWTKAKASLWRLRKPNSTLVLG